MGFIIILIIGLVLFLWKPWKIGRKDLYMIYRVNRETFDKWVTHFVPFEVNLKGKRKLNGLAVIVLIFFLGNPSKKSMTKAELREELDLTEHIMNSQIKINSIISEEVYLDLKKYPPSVCDDIRRHFTNV